MNQHDLYYDERLRCALHAAADSVEPDRDGLERIRARLATPHPRSAAGLLAALSRLTGRAGEDLRAATAWLLAPPGTAVPGPAVPRPVGRRRDRPIRAADWRTWLVPAVCALLVVAVAAGPASLSRLFGGRHAASGATPAATARSNEAAGWIATQVSRSTVVSCDPAMCQALAARGFPARNLDRLQPGATGPPAAGVIVATMAVRQQFGGRLGFGYAPEIIARFGSGNSQIDIRVVAAGGAAAYRSALGQDQQARTAAGRDLLSSGRVVASAQVRRQLLAGHVDSRLLVTIANVAAIHLVSIVAFGDSGPGVGTGSPLRAVYLAEAGHATDAAYTRAVRALLRTENPPYRPTLIQAVRLSSGQRVIRVEFAAPSPIGLITPFRAADVHPGGGPLSSAGPTLSYHTG